MVLSEKRGGQPETETHSLGPALQGCELTHNLTTHLLPFVMMLYTLYIRMCVCCAGHRILDERQTRGRDCGLSSSSQGMLGKQILFITLPHLLPFSSTPLTHSLPPSQELQSSIPQCQFRQFTLSSLRSELSFPLSLRTCSPVSNPLSLLTHKKIMHLQEFQYYACA